MAASLVQSRFVLIALVLTLVSAGFLGVNAVLTGRSHRSVTEGVLRDYAALAADELASQLQAGWAQRIYPLLSAVAARDPKGRLPVPDEIAALTDSTSWRVLGPRATLVRLRPPGYDLDTSGVALAPALFQALADSLPRHVDAFLSPTSYLAALWLAPAGGGSVTFALGTRPSRGAPPLVHGLVVPFEAAGDLVRPRTSRATLLPSSLTHGINLERVVAYRVRTPTGATLLESGDPGASPFAAVRILDSAWGGLRIEVSLDPTLAGHLVIGGLPQSRLPLVALVLGLTAILVATAWAQLRRERELVRQRVDFIASVSHELRTPLAQIRLFAETLRLNRVRSEGERNRSLEIIDQESRRLSHLVENLLTVSRSDRGGIEVTPRPLDLAAELRGAVENFGPIAAPRGVQVVVESPDRLEAAVDSEAFRQIVVNLLDNAIKFGPSGQTVRVMLSDGHGVVHLTVDDQGPGIPVDARERVFGRFVRLEREFAAGIAGTGLGLALVRDLVGLHGGTVTIGEAPGGGARLSVRLPQTAAGAIDG